MARMASRKRSISAARSPKGTCAHSRRAFQAALKAFWTGPWVAVARLSTTVPSIGEMQTISPMAGSQYRSNPRISSQSVMRRSYSNCSQRAVCT